MRQQRMRALNNMRIRAEAEKNAGIALAQVHLQHGAPTMALQHVPPTMVVPGPIGLQAYA